MKIFLFCLSILMMVWCESSPAGGFRYSADNTVVGSLRNHTVQPKETLLDIARKFGLGFNEVEILYSDMDYWVPAPGRRLVMPTQWVLPATRHYGLVINLPELRLYHFFPKYGMVTTYPIGIGVSGWETPVATGRVTHRQVDPTWVVPKTLREKYGVVSVPPGKNNPLGKYWIGLSLDGYGIHGTNFPWGVGRLVSHGCIRLYPEHIALLYQETHVNTPFEIIYEPLKIGIKDHSIFLEVHPDVYQKIPDMFAHAKKRLKDLGFWNSVSTETVKTIVQKQNGVPVFVGYVRKGGDGPIAMGASGF
jgi:L,D-transpeptidase ErfK/SrfK